MKPTNVTVEVAWRERWLEHHEDSIADQTLRPQIEAELDALKRSPATCSKCRKRWAGEMARRYFDRANERCSGYSTCAERARNAAGWKQGAKGHR